MMKLIVKTCIQIQRPINEIFESIVNPDRMKHYFIGEGSGRLEQGKEVIWKWREFPEEFSVNVVKIVENKEVSFIWDSETVVNITLEEQPDRSVVVQVVEGDKELNENNLKWYGGNSEGWANFLACMKAYLEYGINLRLGAFDFMKKNNT